MMVQIVGTSLSDTLPLCREFFLCVDTHYWMCHIFERMPFKALCK